MSKFCVFVTGGSGGPGGPGGSSHKKCREHSDFSSMHKLTNSSTVRLSSLLNRLIIPDKFRVLPGRLSEKFRPNSVRSDWRV